MLTREEFQSRLQTVENAEPSFNDGALYAFEEAFNTGLYDLNAIDEYVKREFDESSDATYIEGFRNGAAFALQTFQLEDNCPNDGLDCNAEECEACETCSQGIDFGVEVVDLDDTAIIDSGGLDVAQQA